MADLEKSDDSPHRRRMTDQPTGNLELILYQISELKAQLREGFAKMDGRFDAAETRITSLERFREREEERARTAAAQSNTINARWVPIVLALVGLAVTVYLATKGGA